MLRVFALLLLLGLSAGFGYWWTHRVPAMERSVPFDQTVLFEWPCYGEPTIREGFSYVLPGMPLDQIESKAFHDVVRAGNFGQSNNPVLLLYHLRQS